MCILFRKQRRFRETFRRVCLARSGQRPVNSDKSSASDSSCIKLKINLLFCFQFQVTYNITEVFLQNNPFLKSAVDKNATFNIRILWISNVFYTKLGPLSTRHLCMCWILSFWVKEDPLVETSCGLVNVMSLEYLMHLLTKLPSLKIYDQFLTFTYMCILI